MFSTTGAMPGWVHEATGKTYATVVGPDGVERDDHCGIPDWSEAGAIKDAPPAIG